jgi:DUF1680 family protein
MRGGEGIASVAEYAYLVDGNTVTVPYFSSSDAAIPVGGGVLSLSQKTAYPYEGHVSFTVRENSVGSPITLSCYVPAAAHNLTVSGADYTYENGMLNIVVTAQTSCVTVDFAIPYSVESPVGVHNEKVGVYTIFRGNLMYSVTTDEMLDCSWTDLIAGKVEGVTLRPLFDAYETDHAPRQVLFS